ncbi:MAG: hypothetical protein AABY26_00315, partial [Nanoarchaeota archaeon]
KEDKEKKIFTRKGMAYSTMSAVMKTTIETNCAQEFGGAAFPQIEKDLLEDCALNYANKEEVDGYSLYQCKGEHSCVFLNQMVVGLLNETLTTWGKRYEFRSKLYVMGDQPPIDLLKIQSIKGGCPKGRERDSSGEFHLNTETGQIKSELWICD